MISRPLGALAGGYTTGQNLDMYLRNVEQQQQLDASSPQLESETNLYGLAALEAKLRKGFPLTPEESRMYKQWKEEEMNPKAMFRGRPIA